MKRLLFIPLVLLSTGLFAQNFQFGLKGGVNISNFRNTNWQNVDNKALIGFHGGALLNLMFGDHFSIQPEALFSSLGSKLEYADREENFKVAYLTIPFMLKYRFNGGFFLEAGPQVGFKLSENVSRNASPGGTAEDFANNLDLSFNAGLGIHGRSGLGVGARYVAGMSKVGNFDQGDLNPDFKNGVIQVSLFYTFFNNNRDAN